MCAKYESSPINFIRVNFSGILEFQLKLYAHPFKFYSIYFNSAYFSRQNQCSKVKNQGMEGVGIKK
jgi:hypothetical protein